LVLRGNSFSGRLPPSFAGLENLENLSLENNQFTGILSTELGTLSNLKYLQLQNNSFVNTSVPDEICALKQGFFQFKKMRRLTADCLSKLNCSCCDKCY